MTRYAARALLAAALLLSARAPLPAQTGQPIPARPAAPHSPATTDVVSPLPPPATRAVLRGRWFQFLSALNDGDLTAASAALNEILLTAHRIGVERLPEFSRGAVFEARHEEELSEPERARAALAAAVQLDPVLVDPRWETMRFDVRHGGLWRAIPLAGPVVRALFSARESRREVTSNFAILACAAVAGTAIAFILVVFVRNIRRVWHDLAEISARILGGRRAAAVTLLLLGLPLWLTLGPVWLFLYWAVLIFIYGGVRERIGLAILLVAAGLIDPVLKEIAARNVISRAPLVAAAIDLEEKQEEGSATDLLQQATRIFPQDDDAWCLLGRFAERRLSYDEAIADFNRALQANPSNFLAAISLGNIHFWQGDLESALQAYHDALKMRPESALAFFNLALAQGDSYLFDQQKDSLARARSLAPREVDRWIENPTLARVRSIPYTVSQAEARTYQWGREARSRALPGITVALTPRDVFLTPAVLGPWGAFVVGLLLGWLARRTGFGAVECARCGRVICARCRPASSRALCAECAASVQGQEAAGIDARAAAALEVRRQQRLRRLETRWASLLVPGARAICAGRPWRGLLVLLVFVFLVSVAVLGGHLFPVFSVGGSGILLVEKWGAALAAFLIWLVADVRTLMRT